MQNSKKVIPYVRNEKYYLGVQHFVHTPCGHQYVLSGFQFSSVPYSTHIAGPLIYTQRRKQGFNPAVLLVIRPNRHIWPSLTIHPPLYHPKDQKRSCSCQRAAERDLIVCFSPIIRYTMVFQFIFRFLLVGSTHPTPRVEAILAAFHPLYSLDPDYALFGALIPVSSATAGRAYLSIPNQQMFCSTL